MSESLIFIGQRDKLNWLEASAGNYTDLNPVTVWRVPILSLIPSLDYLKTLLQPKEIEKINQYKQEFDRRQRLVSKAVLRILLNRYTGIAPVEIRFLVDENKKLYLENNFVGTLQFNVSHSGNWVLIAITNTCVGIDLEQMNASFTYQNMLSFSFSPLEVNYIERSEKPFHSFYQLWTRKESLLKATGKGLVDNLTQVPSLAGVHPSPAAIIRSAQSWQITSFKVDESHVGSVAFNPVKRAVQFFNFRL